MSFVDKIDESKFQLYVPLIMIVLIFAGLYLPLISIEVDGDTEDFNAQDLATPDDSADVTFVYDEIRNYLLIALMFTIVVAGINQLPNLKEYNIYSGFIGLGIVLFGFLALNEVNDVIDDLEAIQRLFGGLATFEFSRGAGFYSVWGLLLTSLIYSGYLIYYHNKEGNFTRQETAAK